MAQAVLNYQECEKIKKAVALMNKRQLNDYLRNIYQAGFDDCREQVGLADSEVHIVDDSKVYQLLRSHHINPALCQKIVDELTENEQ